MKRSCVCLCMTVRSTRWKGKKCVIWSLCSGQNQSQPGFVLVRSRDLPLKLCEKVEVVLSREHMVVLNLDAIHIFANSKAPTFDHFAKSRCSDIRIDTPFIQ